MKTRGDEEHKKTNKRYNEDIKGTVVDLYHSGYSVKELSSEYGISEVTIYKWIKEFTPLGKQDNLLHLKRLLLCRRKCFD
ncbi:transposase family protein [Brevibacillus laterosporus GI-9]|uniref:transposase n=2 Tax=Brevibacillus TaxID=55080 RepID=UPI000240333F|nr:transposase family protein [Brevibacillus laterosporus GI-9]